MAKYVSGDNLSSILTKLKDVFDIKYAASENPEIEGTVTITGYPVNSNHLTTKDYVDRQISNLTYSFVSEEEVDAALIDIFGEVEIVNYVATAAGVMPTFNDEFVNYSLRETQNDDSTYDVSVLSVTGELPTSMTFQNIDKINQINYINLEKIENADNIFNNCNKLNFIKLTSIKYHIINAIINSLPDRTGLEQGTIVIPECDMSQIDVEAAQNKNWVINVYVEEDESKPILIAQYRFDSSLYDLIPTFNEEFTNYNIVDEYLDNENISVASTEMMTILNYDAQPNEEGILTTEYEVEIVTDFLAENIVTRSIYSTELPTMVRFGNKNSATDMQKSLLSVSFVNCDNVTDASYMFNGCRNVTEIIANDWNMSNVTNANYMFAGCSALVELELYKWNTSAITNMEYMFSGDSKLRFIDLNGFGSEHGWNTAKVESMRYMFNNCSSLEFVDGLSKFEMSNVINVAYMFYRCSSLMSNQTGEEATPIIGKARWIAVYDLGISNWATSKITDMSNMFYDCASLQVLTLNWDTSNVKNMSYMFFGCSGLTVLNLNGFSTVNVTNMSYMFNKCKLLTQLYVNNFVMSKVTSTSRMFQQCEKLTFETLECISNWDMSKVRSVNSMFAYCRNLSSDYVDLHKWNLKSCKDTGYMFDSCELMTRMVLHNVNTEEAAYMFSDCHSLRYVDLTGLKLNNCEPDDCESIFDYRESLDTLVLFHSNIYSINNILDHLDQDENYPSLSIIVDESIDLSSLNTDNMDTHNYTVSQEANERIPNPTSNVLLRESLFADGQIQFEDKLYLSDYYVVRSEEDLVLEIQKTNGEIEYKYFTYNGYYDEDQYEILKEYICQFGAVSAVVSIDYDGDWEWYASFYYGDPDSQISDDTLSINLILKQQ